MERPSHLAFGYSLPANTRRLPFAILAISLQVGIAWLFIHGLRGGIPDIIHTTYFVPLPDKPVVKPPPPPLPTLVKPIDTPVEPIIFTVASPERGTTGITLNPGSTGTSAGGTVTPPPMATIRAAIAIKATHTLPPYPPIARRLGIEGKVTLRLTVQADGAVAKAEIVTSSGRSDLDEAAQQWIVRHWSYKPALSNGIPAASQTLAEVTFNLKND